MFSPLYVKIRDRTFLMFLCSIVVPSKDFFLFHGVQLVFHFVWHRVVFQPHLIEERDDGFGDRSHSLPGSASVITVDISGGNSENRHEKFSTTLFTVNQ